MLKADTPGGELKLPDDPNMTQKEKDREKEKEQRKKDREKAKKDREKKPVNPVLGFMGRLLMSLRNASGTYSINDGILLL